MLTGVTIRNFALIESLSLELEPGFNVLTGETGAGKSIVIDAISLLLGGRAAVEDIRSGAPSGYVEGIFLVKEAPGALEVLRDLGVEPEDGQVIIARELGQDRSTARINGRAAPVRALQQLGGSLVDTHGQSEQLSLLRSSRQLDFLDDFAALGEVRAGVAELARERGAIRREIASLRQDERQLAREEDLLRFQVGEIGAANPRPGEDEELRGERNRLANSRRLVELAQQVHSTLASREAGEGSASDLIGRAIDLLGEMAGMDGTLVPRLEQLQAAGELINEIGAAMRQYAESVDDDPAHLNELEGRLDLLATLRRKYGETLAEVIAFKDEAERRLSEIEHSEERLAELNSRLGRLESVLAGKCGGLSARRRQGAKNLREAVVAGLKELGMKEARFAVELSFQPDADGLDVTGADGRVRVDETGADTVTFTVSPNAGEDLKPVAKIASGGETSRIMLALKAALSEVDRTPTLIFDEVDQGVGGRSAQVVGEKLASLAGSHQVVCVTHLPQIAAFADAHFLIQKGVAGGRTVTSVRKLDERERLAELSQMTGSGGGAKRAAEEMVARAAEWRASQKGARKAASRMGP